MQQCNKVLIDLALFVFQTFCYYCLTLLRIHGWHGLAATNGYHLMDVSGGYHPILDQPRIQCSERTNQSVSKRLNVCINKMPLPIQKPCAWHGARLWIKGISRPHLPESQPLIVGRHEQRHTRIGRGVVQVDDQILRRDWLKGIWCIY